MRRAGLNHEAWGADKVEGRRFEGEPRELDG